MNKKILEMIKGDSGECDITTDFTPEKKNTKARTLSRSDGVLSGISELKILFSLFKIKILKSKQDGKRIKKGQEVFLIEGNSRNILEIERTALNLLSKMSGISTLTNEFLKKARRFNPKIKIAATRKTTPFFGYFEKRAVKIGGGDTHRFGLYDAVLIKDNHLKLFGDNIKKALERAKEEISFTKKIEIEVSNKKEAIEAAKFGADIIMLDNFSPREIRDTILELKKKRLREKVILEASGGINLDNIEDYAKTGVNVISIGALTHSAPALDFSLEII
jgi:nicotinate-nucleotide pyrophosphorylase (carboxylating)